MSHPDINMLHAHFNNVASSLFQEVYHAFRNEVAGFVRNGDENVYQMILSKHRHSFRQRLERHANSMIDQCNNQETRVRLRADLTQRIHYFDIEFIRKADES
jgi:hypothetical protein